MRYTLISFFFFFNDTATTEIYTLSLHDALPIFAADPKNRFERLAFAPDGDALDAGDTGGPRATVYLKDHARSIDRKSTRLNSSHANISYAVFCLKKKKIISDQRSEVHTSRTRHP